MDNSTASDQWIKTELLDSLPEPEEKLPIETKLTTKEIPT